LKSSLLFRLNSSYDQFCAKPPRFLDRLIRPRIVTAAAFNGNSSTPCWRCIRAQSNQTTRISSEKSGVFGDSSECLNDVLFACLKHLAASEQTAFRRENNSKISVMTGELERCCNGRIQLLYLQHSLMIVSIYLEPYRNI
jgi:hypothetical protein